MTAQGKPIGFIGLGVMGKSMANHLLNAGYELHLYNRTREKAEELLEHGAHWHDSPRSVAAHTDILISIVGFPRDVELVYTGQNGVFEGARPGSLHIDMTTSSPALAIKLAALGKKLGCHVLDAPVSGGDRGAREATLTIMVGGTETAFSQALPLLRVFGQNIVHQGPPGSGQYTKMCNQIAIAAGMVGVCESIAFARASGLNPESVLSSIASGAAASWSLSNLAPRALHGDFKPGFFVKHFLKDMRIALDSARELNLSLPGLELAHRLYEKLARDGGADLGTQALLQLYEKRQLI